MDKFEIHTEIKKHVWVIGMTLISKVITKVGESLPNWIGLNFYYFQRKTQIELNKSQ